MITFLLRAVCEIYSMYQARPHQAKRACSSAREVSEGLFLTNTLTVISRSRRSAVGIPLCAYMRGSFLLVTANQGSHWAFSPQDAGFTCSEMKVSGILSTKPTWHAYCASVTHLFDRLEFNRPWPIIIHSTVFTKYDYVNQHRCKLLIWISPLQPRAYCVPVALVTAFCYIDWQAGWLKIKHFWRTIMPLQDEIWHKGASA